MNPVPLVLILEGAVPEVAVVGGKGASLAHLIGAGLPVPDTAVVTTEAYRRFAAAAVISDLTDRIRDGESIAGDEVDATFLTNPIDEDLGTEIHRVARGLGDGSLVAVRSSATAEDLAAHSFAGQYRSLLNVEAHDPDALTDAVRLVWASAWHPAPAAYRRALQIDDVDQAMAVVIMAMVPATSAGVVFTRDPAGGRDLARIESVSGLGESLVSGAETPEAWVVPRSDPRSNDAPPEVTDALRLSLEVEQLFGRPQDVEWAYDGTRTWIVQARPITTASAAGDGFDTETDDHELTTAGVGEMVPGVLPPLRWQVCSLLLEEAFRRLLDDLGVDADVRDTACGPAPMIRRVRGRAALDFHQLRTVADALPGGAVEELESQYFGTGRDHRPEIGSRRSPLTLLHDLRVISARRRAVESSSVVVAAVERCVGSWPDLSSLTDDGLLSYRRRLVDLAGRGTEAEMAVAAAGAAAYRRLELLVGRHLGTERAARHAQLTTVGAGAGVPRRLDASAAVFAGPTWRELGREPTSLVDDETRRRDAYAELEWELTAQPHWRTTRILTGQVIDVRIRVIRRAITDAVRLLNRREQTKAAVMTIGGEVRRVHLEIGRRLCAAGVLERREDVELLGERELRDTVGSGTTDRGVLDRRRRVLEQYEAMGSLPLRFVGGPDDAAEELPPGERLEGWAASPGRYTGPARVIAAPDDPLEPGEVLVATATDASFSPLFVRAGAVVVERGGPLSHAAILARELGLPAVLNVTGATRALDGRTVTVDGGSGSVVIVDAADAGRGPR